MIVRTRNRGDMEIRSFALTDMTRYGYSGLRNYGPIISEASAKGLPALYRAARLRAEAVASLRLCCWRGEGPTREKVTNTWQARLFRDEPNEEQTRFGFWETVEESLAWRNNAFIWKNIDPQTERVIELWALHPDQVTCRDEDYEVKMMSGYVDPVGRGPAVYRVDETTILHIRGHGDGGKYEAPTPIQVFREAIAAPVGRQKHEVRMWRRGTALQVAIQFPENVTPERASQWKEQWRANYEGLDGETTGVVGGGASIVPIGMTAADAAYVEMAKLSVLDASRIMGVPANLLGAQLERSVPNLEQDLMTWLRFGLGPELERIESALVSDDDLFGDTPPNRASVYPGFDTDQFVRGDLATEATILQTRVQSGILTPDEARQILGYPPHPDGVGAIPQITPVGGAPNPDMADGMPAMSQNGMGDH